MAGCSGSTLMPERGASWACRVRAPDLPPCPVRGAMVLSRAGRISRPLPRSSHEDQVRDSDVAQAEHLRRIEDQAEGPATASATAGDLMRILLVEDDKDLQRLLKKALTEAGYVVDSATDGEEGHFLGDTEPYDAVILDLGLPKVDGVTVLERWRKAGRKMPVLILTARDRWSDKVAGFDAGADDYLAKPFYTEELLARLRALLRRAAGIASPDIEIGPLRIDTRSSRVTVDGNPIKLTSAEYRLLSFLAHHKGEVLSRTDLTEHLYDQDFDRDSNTIEVFIGRLRKKLGVDVIHTVRGLGYRLDESGARGDET